MEELRNKLNEIDDEIVKLYLRRMEVVADIGKEKDLKRLPIASGKREKEVLDRITASATPEMKKYLTMLYQTIFETSKAYQTNFTSKDTKLTAEIKSKLLDGYKKFPTSASVAVQGIEGAYSESAARRIFEDASLSFCNSFESVFRAVDKGLCKYGVLPIDNSTFGTVGRVYDLLNEYKFYIVKSVKLEIKHSLLAKAGVELKDVKEVISHEQAIGQCAEFIEKSHLKVTLVQNTAVAAETVANSDRNDIAAIASAECASIYGLKVLKSGIQNEEENYTRFICISKDFEIYEDANRISLVLGLPHKSGSLYRTLSRFSALNLNLTKLSSRPVAGTDFEYLFYLDFESNVAKNEALSIIAELDNECESFAFLGSYQEIA